MKFKTWNEKKEIELLLCPFCGGEPTVKHIGNDHSRVRKLEIACSICRIKRIAATLKHDFEWLEDIEAENWNKRVGLS